MKQPPDKPKPAQRQPRGQQGEKPAQDKENALQRLVREDPEKVAQMLRDILSRK